MAELLLNYATQPSIAHLEEFEGGVRLTFPVLSRRIRLINLISYFFAAIAQTFVLGMNIWQWRSLQQQFAAFSRTAGPNAPVFHPPVSGIFLSMCYAILFWIGAILVVSKTRQQSTQPEVWEAMANELVIWRFNGFRLRRMIHHPVGVQSVEATPIRDIFGRKDMVILAIKFNNGRKRIARKTTGADSLVARRAAIAFRKILNLSKEDN